MSKQKRFILFICNLVLWTIANGLVPLLPVQAASLGAQSTIIGFFMAFSYVMLAIGTMLSGWLVERGGTHKLLIMLISFILIPMLAILGQVDTVWQLTIVSGVVSLCLGLIFSLLTMLISLNASKVERGKIFGTIYLSIPLGALLGGATFGTLIDWGGYTTMYNVIAMGGLLLPITAIFWPSSTVDQAIDGEDNDHVAPTQLTPWQYSHMFILFLGITLVAYITSFIGRLGTSLVMTDLQFAATAISSTAAIGGLVALPIVPLLGSMSDRVGRKRFLSVIYITATLGILTLSQATSLWQFWLAAALISIATYSNGSLASALATDLLSPQSMNKGMALFNATAWIAGIIGYAATGYVIEQFDATTIFAIGTAMPVLAVVMLGMVRVEEKPAKLPVTSSISRPYRVGVDS